MIKLIFKLRNDFPEIREHYHENPQFGTSFSFQIFKKRNLHLD